jgi:UDP-N-acetylglucosamine--N-acetylmuramyl-(pentapeptide) pyrophosphoryl-undecaprenol N-acetylglucosamine transferase
MKLTKTIVITGGHVTPALAVIDALKRDASIVFFGRKYAMEGSRSASFEYQLITGKGIKFIAITTGRLQRHMTWRTIPSILKIPVGCIQALWYCARVQPSLIVSFGGYVALPTAIAGWLCRIPVITHEQTMTPGLANRIIARIAKRVCVTFPASVGRFPKGQAVVTGLPMREELFTPPKKAPFALDVPAYPLIYVTGGGTGAQSLNRIVYPVLPSLVRKYTIIHQVGDTSLAEAQKIREALDEEYKNRYIVESYIPISSIAWVLSHAALVLGRAGANTIMELAAFGKVSVLVPLPWSAEGEQQQNADWLARHGGAVVLTQSTLTPQRLKKEIEATWADIATLQKRASAFALQIPRDGTRRFVREIEHVLSAT